MGRGPKYQFNVFERIESIKDILEPIVQDRDRRRTRALVLRCAKYQVKQINTLTETETKIYDILLKHKYTPKRVYEWLLLEDVPKHIKEKVALNKISLVEAGQQYVQWKRMTGTQAGKTIMDEMRNIIRRLRWKSQEEIPTMRQ